MSMWVACAIVGVAAALVGWMIWDGIKNPCPAPEDFGP